MADKLMYTPNDDTQNYPYCSLQLVVKTFGYRTYEPTNQNSIIVPKVVKPTNNLKTLGTRVINSPPTHSCINSLNKFCCERKTVKSFKVLF